MNLTRRQFGRAGLLLSLPSLLHSALPEIRIGITPVILADQAAFLSRWANYLGERIEGRVTFVARTQYQQILDMLMEERIDAAWLCGYPFIQNQSHLSLLAVPLYQGSPTYQAYLIRPRNSSIRNWADLRNKVLAYSDRLSNSGWLVAQQQLLKAGVAPTALKKTFFAHGHRNVAESVASRLADAGAIDGYVWETMRLQGLEAALSTEVAWRSNAFGFPPLVVLKSASNLRLESLKQTLLAMQESSTGRALLSDLNLDGFIAGDPSLYESIRQTAHAVNESEIGL